MGSQGRGWGPAVRRLGSGKDAIQPVLVVVVIIAMLAVMGVPVSVIVFFTIVSYIIWRLVQRTDSSSGHDVFQFYIAANEILRDADRRWFGFEVYATINSGECVLMSMPDPPPLVYFTLGALYHHVGDFETAALHLGYIVDNDLSDERHRLSPSPQLQSYVQTLRRVERDPSVAPLTLAAVRCLERVRGSAAAALLESSRARLKVIPSAALKEFNRPSGDFPMRDFTVGVPPASLFAHTSAQMLAPPPIADVLRDVYDETKKTA